MAEPVRAFIRGMGSFAPDKVLTNADFEKFLDTSDEWIVKRTGIRERHVVSDGESTSTLATEAARRAMTDAGIAADELEMIICATVSPDMPFPCTACFIQECLALRIYRLLTCQRRAVDSFTPCLSVCSSFAAACTKPS